jgi:hypothetical protein
MMEKIRRILGLEPSPTFWDAAPAPRDPEQEAAINSAKAELVQSAMEVGVRHHQVRQELAENVVKILQGER